MYWTPAKMLLLADVDKYSFTNAAYIMCLFHHDINEVVKQSSNTPLCYE